MASDEDPAGGGTGGLSRRELIERSIGASAALTVPGLIAACGGSSNPSASSSSAGSPAGGKPRRGGHLTVAIHDGGATDTLAPWSIPIFSAAARAGQVFERLYTWDSTSRPRPVLAVSAEPDKTATVWRVKLRQGVTFHNGKTLTADDVLYSVRYIANPKNNAEALARIQAIDPRASRAVSPTELEFHLSRPIGDFPGLLADKALWIVPAGTTDFSKPIGTGPFVFKSWQPGIRALFERNPRYWQIGAGGGPPWVDSLEIQIITDNTARLNALLGGQVQEITNIDLVAAKAQASNPAIRIIRTPQPYVTPIYMEIDAPAFRDIRVRHALKLAVDRKRMVDNILLGYGSVGNDLYGKGFPSYNADIPQRPYDPQQAASLLKQAGVGRMRLTLPTSEIATGMLASAIAFKQQAAPVGVDVTLQKIDTGTYFSNNLYLKVPFYQSQNVDSFEATTQDLLLLKSPYNETHWYDAQWQAGFFRAQGIVDSDKRNAAYKALQVPLWDRGGYIIWGVYPVLDATASNVRGIVPYLASGFQDLGSFAFKYHWLAA